MCSCHWASIILPIKNTKLHRSQQATVLLLSCSAHRNAASVCVCMNHRTNAQSVASISSEINYTAIASWNATAVLTSLAV